MPGFDGTGPRGMGPMTGGGRGFCGPYGARAIWRPYEARQWARYGYPYGAPPTREQELDFLKDEARALKDHLKQLETEMGKLSAEKR
jgi:hypothetical protein